MLFGVSMLLSNEEQIKPGLKFFFYGEKYEAIIENAKDWSFENLHATLDQLYKLRMELSSQMSGKEIKRRSTALRSIPDKNIDLFAMRPDNEVRDILNFALIKTHDDRDSVQINGLIGLAEQVETVGDDEFEVNLATWQVSHHGNPLLDFRAWDLNIPLEFNSSDFKTSLKGKFVQSLNDEELIMLALELAPTYQHGFITIDYIEQARQLCAVKGLISAEDMNYLVDEHQFVTKGDYHVYLPQRS